MKIKMYRIISLLLVSQGCETWSLTLRGGCRIRLFEKRALRAVFGQKRDEMIGGWRKLCIDELNAVRQISE
jgi:hypothetical protein